MAIFDLFSKRQKRLRGEFPDVYQYENIVQSFRVQVVHIVKATIGEESSYRCRASDIYRRIHETLCREYGVFYLRQNADTNFSAVFDYFLNEEDHEKCLDIIELTFRIIDRYVRAHEWEFRDAIGVSQTPGQAIDELNARFKEAGIGYQFESGELIRVDSQYVHSEVVRPVLYLLGKSEKYAGVNDEFLSAHEHYRHKRYKECLNDCLKSFESLMKAIHEKHSWSYNKNDTARKLISSCLTNGLVPDYLQTQFSSVRSLLESGVPTVRNKEGGHGQGTMVTSVPEHLASYILHLTATNLLFLGNCEEQYS
ncbi:STM4504/CBY_0614 family protein [Microbulbifer sp. PAAF003]|uniref:STM4504/CBY_0614 family protein n=1 Tax=Microbulbifer sp. PAAF003 TaxID=3243375 RepID=UPI0040397EEE